MLTPTPQSHGTRSLPLGNLKGSKPLSSWKQKNNGGEGFNESSAHKDGDIQNQQPSTCRGKTTPRHLCCSQDASPPNNNSSDIHVIDQGYAPTKNCSYSDRNRHVTCSSTLSTGECSGKSCVQRQLAQTRWRDIRWEKKHAHVRVSPPHVPFVPRL